MWLDVKQRHKLHTAVMVYKVNNYLALSYMTRLLSNVSEVNSYNTRVVTIENASLNTKNKTFQWRATQIWNALPVSLRGTISLIMFKSVCAKFIVQLS